MKFHDKHFPSICNHAMNLLFSFNVFKGFKTILQHTEIKMIEIMANCERSYLVCNVTKNAKKHIQKAITSIFGLYGKCEKIMNLK